MEPLSTAATFATLVGLLSSFSGERRGRASATYEEFMEWLVTNQHSDLVGLIQGSDRTIVSIKALLHMQHDELLARLGELDASIAQLATGFAAFRGIALAIYPDSELSAQASGILMKFVDSGAGKLLAIPYLSEGLVLQFLDGPGGNVEVPEPRFIEDDLATLVGYGLFREEINGAGNSIYSITRKAIRHVEAIRNGA